ncbi:Protein of unknown function [Gryllus bimaculatus]|nr:Protein of unknown function [Gryllus bimaculatus]
MTSRSRRRRRRRENAVEEMEMERGKGEEPPGIRLDGTRHAETSANQQAHVMQTNDLPRWPLHPVPLPPPPAAGRANERPSERGQLGGGGGRARPCECERVRARAKAPEHIGDSRSAAAADALQIKHAPKNKQLAAHFTAIVLHELFFGSKEADVIEGSFGIQ